MDEDLEELKTWVSEWKKTASPFEQQKFFRDLEISLGADFKKFGIKVHPVKERTLEQVHDLWLRAVERAEKRHKMIGEFIRNTVVKELRKKGGAYILYHDCEEDGMNYYEIKKDDDFGGYSHSYHRVSNSDRDGKLKHLLAVSEKSLALGKQFRFLEHDLSTDMHHKLFGKVWGIIKRNLEDHYREKYEAATSIYQVYVEEVVTVQIGEYSYYVSVENRRSGWFKFTYEGVNQGTNFNFTKVK